MEGNRQPVEGDRKAVAGKAETSACKGKVSLASTSVPGKGQAISTQAATLLLERDRGSNCGSEDEVGGDQVCRQGTRLQI